MRRHYCFENHRRKEAFLERLEKDKKPSFEMEKEKKNIVAVMIWKANLHFRLGNGMKTTH